MPIHRQHLLHAVWLSVALHAGVLLLAGASALQSLRAPDTVAPEESVIFVEALAPPMPEVPPPDPPPPAPASATAVAPPAPPAPPSERAPASMDAPPAPSAEEWALAARYTLKNSKRYRYAWGQQVRSLMGTAVEGPEQGIVRFRIEIAPDGSLARVQILWTTSASVEARARQAIEQLPALPPTPNGQPLIFEKTVAFQAFDSGGPPLYRDDCLPDPPAFNNPFAWDGRSPTTRQAPPGASRPDPREMEECLKQLQPDSIEAESANDRRQLEQWGSSRLGR
jgi:hypothetical protein